MANEKMSNGWVKLNRKVQANWIYPNNRPYTQFEAWIDLILNANHTEREVNIKNEIYHCKRGQQIRSLDKLSSRWNWNKSKVRRFLKLLQSCSMIVTEPDTKATRITLCNYDKYQAERNADETEMKRKRNSGETRMKLNNNVYKENNENELEESADDIEVQAYSALAQKSADVIDSVISIFAEIYRGSNNVDYIPIAHDKERAAASKIVDVYRIKYPNLSKVEVIQGLRDYFELVVTINDDWLRNHMSLPLIVNKFNEINNILKNGRIKKTGATTEQIANILAREF